jgi:hypothetical protein
MVDFAYGRYITKTVVVASTSAGAASDTIYTVPSRYIAHLSFLMVSNGGATSKKVYIQRKLGGTSTYETIIDAMIIQANNTLTVLDGSKLCLNGTDEIKVYMEAGSTLKVTISATEFYNPAGA